MSFLSQVSDQIGERFRSGTVDAMEGELAELRGESQALLEAQYVTPEFEKIYGLNNPKSYFGYAIALRLADGDRDEADQLTTESVVGTAKKARIGAMHLGLVASERDGRQYRYFLTPRGEVVTTALMEQVEEETSPLAMFEELKGSSTRLETAGDIWPAVTRLAVLGDGELSSLLDAMYELEATGGTVYTDGEGEIEPYSLGGLALGLREEFPGIATGYFFRGAESGLLADPESFRDADVDQLRQQVSARESYSETPVTKHKAVLWHLGLLTQRKGVKHAATPVDDEWRLAESVRPTE